MSDWMPGVYYNEFDPFAAAWLRELIKAGHIADGDVDDRSILEVTPDDVRGYAQCHWFAGIGGWSYALRLAGWPDDRPVWTASLPCQPYSAAGKGEGHADPRNLWPAFHRLVRESRPGRIFGEQVEAAIGFGWLDGVFVDLEGLGYACGAAVLPAASVGAPHIRHRLYWLADAEHSERWSQYDIDGEAHWGHGFGGSGDADGMADAAGPRTVGDLGREGIERCTCWSESCGCRAIDRLGDACQERLQRPERLGELVGQRPCVNVQVDPWCDSRPILCRDGKYRRIPVESEVQPLVAGLSPERVGILRGAGNAIVPQVASAFVSAYMDTVADPAVQQRPAMFGMEVA